MYFYIKYSPSGLEREKMGGKVRSAFSIRHSIRLRELSMTANNKKESNNSIPQNTTYDVQRI